MEKSDDITTRNSIILGPSGTGRSIFNRSSLEIYIKTSKIKLPRKLKKLLKKRVKGHY